MDELLTLARQQPPYTRIRKPYSECPHCGEYNYKIKQASEDGEEWTTVQKKCDNCKYKGDIDE